MNPEIVLASTSAGRRNLLARLQLPFDSVAPETDETPNEHETAPVLAERLARDKAAAVAMSRPNSIVIGADQVADVDGQIVGKPGSEAAARAQLRAQSGRTVLFYTGLAVSAPSFQAPESTIETVKTQFRSLTDAQIDAYVTADAPMQTAGTLKSEGLGIALVSRIESDDPSTLIGLPLIALTDLLIAAGINLPPASG